MGFEVTLSQRLESAQHDVLSMTGLYLPIISVSFLIALPVAALVIKRYPNLRRLGFVLGGICRPGCDPFDYKASVWNFWDRTNPEHYGARNAGRCRRFWRLLLLPPHNPEGASRPASAGLGAAALG